MENSFRQRRFRMFIRACLLAVAAVCLLQPLMYGGAQKPGPSTPIAAVPADVLTMMCGPDALSFRQQVDQHCERFRDPQYVAIFSGTAHGQWDPQTLYARLTAAHEAGEEFKALFLARLYGITLSPVQLASVVFTTILASFTVPGIPGGSIIAMVPILAAARVPIDGLGILLAIDTIPDMFRTTANATGILTLAAVLRKHSY